MSESVIQLAVVPDTGLINLRGNPANEEFMTAIKRIAGCELPTVPNTVAGSDTQACWLGPDEWMLISSAEQASSTRLALQQALQGQHVAINDLSGGHLRLRLSGDQPRDLLAKGCTLDLHPAVFGAGACAQTGLAKAGVLVVAHASGPGVDLVVRRSFSDYLLQWLQKAGAEYRIEFV